MKKKTHFDKTAAETKSIGFDYQYYFFLWKLLSLKVGESVGLEVKDDVHTELKNDEQIFYQIKHSIKTKADGSNINLTASDTDLWKTLSNWAQVISDKNDQRGDKIEQLNFLTKTSFVLASNKSSASNNNILKCIVEFQSDNCTLREIKQTFQTLSVNSKDQTLVNYINITLSLEDEVLNEFLLKVIFELDQSDIIEKCKDAIKSDKIDVHKIDSVFANIDSAIRSDNFIHIKNGEKVQISFDDFYLKYRKHYDIARNGSLTINEFKGSLPDNLKSQVFIQQLIEIEDFPPDNLEEIATLTRFKLKLQNNIDAWLQDGVITDSQVTKLKEEAKNQWRNKHKQNFRRNPTESNHNKLALDVLDSIRENILIIDEQPLDTGLSNGAFYALSDEPSIGWRNDWTKYKK